MPDEITPTTTPVESADLVTSDEVLVSSVEEPTQEVILEPIPESTPQVIPEITPQATIEPALESVSSETKIEPEPVVNSDVSLPVENPVPTQTTPVEPVTESVIPTVSPAPEVVAQPQPQSTTIPLEPADLPKDPASNGTRSIKEVTYGMFNIPRSILMQMLEKANIAKEKKRRKKLEKIFTLFEKHKEITNDMVEKLLHVSDDTATKYLNILLKEGRIQRIGKAGGTKYIKV